MTKMKAVQVSKPGGEFELVLRDVPEPADSQVRIRVLACGVCHGDAIVKEGGAFANIQYPRIPGHEVVGIIDKLGAEADGCSVGQRVGVGWPAGISYDGGFAEYLIAPANQLVHIPEELDTLEAAPLLCAGSTTFDALRHAGAQPGDVVAIQGVGGLGHLAVQYAHRMGFKTVALSRGTAKENVARNLGADIYIDTEATKVDEELQKLGGAKVILVTAPNNKVVTQLVNGLGPDGKLIIVAGINGPIQVYAGQLMQGRRSVQAWVATTPGARRDAIEFSMLKGVEPIIEIFPLDDVAQAYARMMDAEVRFRAVLTM